MRKIENDYKGETIMNNEIKTSLKASEEIDLTEFKLSKRTDHFDLSFARSYIFEKKLDHYGNLDLVYEVIEEYSKIISTTNLFRPRYMDGIRVLIPVINIKVCDYWNINGGKPIHWTAEVERITPGNNNSKVVFTLNIHEFNTDAKTPTRKINVVAPKIISRNLLIG